MTLSNKELEKRINTLDLSLFSQIESQSNDAEKKSFLLLQKIIRNTIASYTYLEIGSHLGGSLQSYFIDPKCRRIFSIDKRPTSQPDIRGKHYFYENNSTQRMLANLKQAFPDGNLDKLTTIDKSTNEIDTQEIFELIDICFIDGEHTNEAAYHDFLFCFTATKSNSIIIFHDAYFVFKAIQDAEQFLRAKQVDFKSYVLGGGVYVLLIGSFSKINQSEFTLYVQDKEMFFRSSQNLLKAMQRENLFYKRWGTSWASKWVYFRLYSKFNFLKKLGIRRFILKLIIAVIVLFPF